MQLHSRLRRRFVRASKPLASSPTPTTNPSSYTTPVCSAMYDPTQYILSSLPILPFIPRVTSLFSLPQPQPQPQPPLGEYDQHSSPRRIWIDEPPFPEEKMKLEEAVRWLGFIEKLPVEELSLLRRNTDVDSGIDRVMNSKIAASTTAFYSGKLIGNNIESRGRMEDSDDNYEIGSGKTDKLNTTRETDICDIQVNDCNSDETRRQFRRSSDYPESYGPHDTSSSSSTSSLPIFTYTSLPRPPQRHNGASTSSSLRNSTFKSLQCADPTPFTSPISARVTSSPCYNSSSFPYTSSSTSSGAESVNSHSSFYAQSKSSDSEDNLSSNSHPSFYALPQYSDIEDLEDWDEVFIRRESFSSQASGLAGMLVGTEIRGCSDGEEFRGTGVGSVSDLFGTFDWEQEVEGLEVEVVGG